ncbi:hypothetical protein RF11_04790 [Thelohanellus kitauei]|uniref:Uncharacterized protein n=1 Tax=Thelohanellus kitauei TaxID=669202 RepID=A0A0C2MGC4_THEKT|nr:hypothetical protein RF11_04790 [Thelohanellus kitauei]
MATRMSKAEQISYTRRIFKFDNFDDKAEPWTIYIQRFELAVGMQGLDIEGNELDALKRDLFMANVGSTHFKYISENLKDVFTRENGYEAIIEFMSARYTKRINKGTGVDNRFCYSPKGFGGELRFRRFDRREGARSIPTQAKRATHSTRNHKKILL